MEQSKFYQVKNITEHEYTLVGCDGSVITRPIQDVDKSASIFTIQDAKNGDMLASGEVVFIFKTIHSVWLNCHCSAHKDGSFIADSYDLLTDRYFGEVFPATKEQRDALMKAMTASGYEWDADKKELRKIENSPILSNSSNTGKQWTEEDERNLAIVKGYLDGFQDFMKEISALIDWLNSLKQRLEGTV